MQRRVLGAEHPDTLKTATNLARIFRAQEQYEEATALERETLDVRRPERGAEHPDQSTSADTLAMASNLAGPLLVQGGTSHNIVSAVADGLPGPSDKQDNY